MTSPAEHELFERLVARFAPEAVLLHAQPLGSGVYASVTALEIVQPGRGAQKLIVRRHSAADRARNPRIAADEFRLLDLLRASGFPAPAPVYVDDGELGGDSGGEPTIFATPCIVIEYVAGGPAPSLADAPDAHRQLAALLARLHRLAIAPSELAFLPDENVIAGGRLLPPIDPILRAAVIPSARDGAVPSVRDGASASEHEGAVSDERDHGSIVPTPDEQRIRAALAARWPPPHPNPPVLLHGDFWPGNTLWRDGRLSAVIDWEDAARGDPLADLASSRLEILWTYGAEAMHEFTAQYRALNPLDFSSLPYWELSAALRQLATLSGWGLEPAAEEAFRQGLRAFVDRAFAQLAAGAA